jgi:hypothetical protein
MHSFVHMALLGAAVALASCSHASDSAPVCSSAGDALPTDLACTGLYADFKTKTIAPAARLYAPAVPFWSDGFEKSRYIALPDGARIDASNMDDWKFPVGTKVWKEFRKGDRKVETRLLWKIGDQSWNAASYVWSDDGTSATRGEGRVLTVGGGPYTVPSIGDCSQCHRGRSDKLLGFEAISLAQPNANGVTLAVLAAEGRIAPAPSQTTVTLPHAAFGILHINCGVTCHNTTPGAVAGDSTLRLRLGWDEVSKQPASQWQLYATSVGVATQLPAWNGELRIAPGSPDKSSIVGAMSTRLTGQMPPLATTLVDEDSVNVLGSWIKTLPASPASP